VEQRREETDRVSYDCCACGGAEGDQPCILCLQDHLNREHLAALRTNAEKVGEFHKAFGVEEPKVPTLPSEEVIELRLSLMDEELHEVIDALGYYRHTDDGGHEILRDRLDRNLADIAKELADLLVVTYGTARAFGIPIDEVFDAVHRSNMSKLGEDGKPIRREDGKVLKGPNYQPAEGEVSRIIPQGNSWY
jgi:predicted HAD superfamily Cof-like phosphohydrolase